MMFEIYFSLINVCCGLVRRLELTFRQRSERSRVIVLLKLPIGCILSAEPFFVTALLLRTILLLEGDIWVAYVLSPSRCLGL